MHARLVLPLPTRLALPLRAAGEAPQRGPAVLGLLRHGAGRVGLYGDSSCLDSSHSKSRCFGLLSKMLQFAAGEVGRSEGLVPGGGVFQKT